MCEMCGSEEKLYRAEIEGTRLNVCEQCAKFGNIINAIDVPGKKELKKKEIKRFESEEPKKKVIYIVSDDFAAKIRKARERMGLTQEDFAKRLSEKESIVQKLERGEFTPSLKLARKLERMLGISLIESYEEGGKEFRAVETEGFTIGDILKIKKRS